jgi:hypothetical protein
MRAFGMVLLVSAVAFGQQRSGSAHVGAVVRSGGYSTGLPTGNPAFPGTVYRGNSYAGVRPYRPRTGTAAGLIYVPYAVGGYQYYGPQQGDPGVDMVYPNQQGAAPMVVINQNFIPQTASPIVREYMPDQGGGIQVYPPPSPGSAQQPESSSQESPAFLIAFKDHTIYAAVGYWVEGDTLHYITSGNTHNQVSLDLVDRELSARLNGERGVDFLLPPSHK